MFHKVKYVSALPDYKLVVVFSEGVIKKYDMEDIMNSIPIFTDLKNDDDLYNSVSVDIGGYGIVWNDEIDISCDELWEKGVRIKSQFDGLMAFSDATKFWNLNESTLRKAISYGKLKVGVDVCKYGKQWVVSTKAMEREYGKITDK